MNKTLIIKAVLAVLVIAGVVGYSVYHKKKAAAVPAAEQGQVQTTAPATNEPQTVDQRYGNFTIPTDSKGENK